MATMAVVYGYEQLGTAHRCGGGDGKAIDRSGTNCNAPDSETVSPALLCLREAACRGWCTRIQVLALKRNTGGNVCGNAARAYLYAGSVGIVILPASQEYLPEFLRHITGLVNTHKFWWNSPV